MLLGWLSEDALREWLIAFGSFGALLVAIYVGLVAGVLRRPSLYLAFHPHQQLGDAVTVGTFLYREDERVGDSEAAYVRLRVGNRRRRHTAEDVEVLILAMDRLDVEVPSPNLGDFPLAWSNTHPVTTTRNVSPGVQRHVDLLHVLEQHPYGPARKLAMAVFPPPTDGRHHLEPGRYLIALGVIARNAGVRHYAVTVDYDGGWEPKIWDRLHVGPPERLGRRRGLRRLLPF
jgi:hypothetical protein